MQLQACQQNRAKYGIQEYKKASGTKLSPIKNRLCPQQIRKKIKYPRIIFKLQDCNPVFL